MKVPLQAYDAMSKTSVCTDLMHKQRTEHRKDTWELSIQRFHLSVDEVVNSKSSFIDGRGEILSFGLSLL